MFVVLASLFMACGTPKDGYVVKGSLKNAGDGYAVISVADHTGASVIADTAEMSGGKFRFEGKTPFVAACSLRVVPEGKEVLGTNCRRFRDFPKSGTEYRGEFLYPGYESHGRQKHGGV